jgi:hypothetical protein
MQLQVEKGLKAALLADATLSSQIGTRCANQFAHELQKPYIVFSLNAGRDSNLQTRPLGDLNYLIKAVVGENSGGNLVAAQIAEAIYAALNDHSFAVDSPWAVYRVQRKTLISYVESNTEREQIYHQGAIYRIRVSGDF